MAFYFAKSFEDLGAQLNSDYMDGVRQLVFVFLYLGYVVVIELIQVEIRLMEKVFSSCILSLLY